LDTLPIQTDDSTEVITSPNVTENFANNDLSAMVPEAEIPADDNLVSVLDYIPTIRSILIGSEYPLRTLRFLFIPSFPQDRSSGTTPRFHEYVHLGDTTAIPYRKHAAVVIFVEYRFAPAPFSLLALSELCVTSVFTL